VTTRSNDQRATNRNSRQDVSRRQDVGNMPAEATTPGGPCKEKEKMSSQELIVVKVDKVRTLLAEARDANDAKKVADLALAAEVYAKR
jgi:hypothetical protein